MPDGILIIDKPAGISSARAVAIVKRLLPRGTRVGHAGTLDPFATGVLLVLIGKATRQCEALMGLPKGYIADVKLGATTETLDPESPERLLPINPAPSRRQVEAVLAGWIGTVQQRPPAFSAMKVGGRRAYALARQGETVELAARPVRVDHLQVLDYAWPIARIGVRCGRGFYVRSLARDLGEALGTGGYLTALRRTAVGEFDINAATPLETLRTTDDIEAMLSLSHRERAG